MSEDKICSIQSGLGCFDNFKCIASKCSDNCCVGWEIDIDDDTLDYYNSIEGTFGEKLRDNIFVGDCSCFKMDSNDRCPFLNDKNLCEIIITLGEDKIPYICTHHPRFYEWLYDRCEMGIGICCPEAARMLFESDEKIKINISCKNSKSISDIMSYVRNTAFYILQNRELSIAERMIIFLNMCEEADTYLIRGNLDKLVYIADSYRNYSIKDMEVYQVEDLTSSIFNLFSSLEPINKQWEDYINILKKSETQILNNRTRFLSQLLDMNYKYEHLLIYLTYRYFLKCLDDENLLSKAGFIVVCTLFNVLMDIYSYIKNEKDSRVNNSVLFSKEVEYSQENINIIYEAVCEEFLNLHGYIKFLFN